MRCDTRTVLALIEITARLLAACDVDHQSYAADVDGQLAWRSCSGEHTAARRQAFFVARTAFGTLEDAARRTELDEQVAERGSPRVDARRQELTREVVAIPIHDEPWQPVGLCKHEPARRLPIEQPQRAPRFDRPQQP